jgi:hypothetical protein
MRKRPVLRFYPHSHFALDTGTGAAVSPLAAR